MIGATGALDRRDPGSGVVAKLGPCLLVLCCTFGCAHFGDQPPGLQALEITAGVVTTSLAIVSTALCVAKDLGCDPYYDAPYYDADYYDDDYAEHDEPRSMPVPPAPILARPRAPTRNAGPIDVQIGATGFVIGF